METMEKKTGTREREREKNQASPRKKKCSGG
jgi:hypothetical protein